MSMPGMQPGVSAYDAIGDLTPWQEHQGVWVKRDDLFSIAGVQGGKVRTCWQLATAGQAAGADTLVTAGSRSSPQVNIVAQIGKHLGMATIAYTPQGVLGDELIAAQLAGCEIIQVQAGYNSVIRARARDHAAAAGHHVTHIPFGMECREAVEATASQVPGMPPGLPTLWVPVGSGMSLAGILEGIEGLPSAERPQRVVGVMVGADPTKRLDHHAPPWWRALCTLVRCDLDYHAAATDVMLGDLELDPIYEAKLLPYVQPGDGLWVVGVRQYT